MDEYVRSDLACECGAIDEEERDATFREEERCGFRVQCLEIKSEAAAKRIGREVGRYVTVDVGRIWEEMPQKQEEAENVIGEGIKETAKRLGYKSGGDVLVCGLGNRLLTADSLGPLCADGVLVTRQVKETNGYLFDTLHHESVASVSPGVAPQTGMETADILLGICEKLRPALVIVVDALAARDTARLATTVQLCDRGLAPGSGVGGRRVPIDRETLGVPVMSLGAPTVVDSVTLVRDALEKAGVGEREAILGKVKGFFVSPGDADAAVACLASILSRAIDFAFSI